MSEGPGDRQAYRASEGKGLATLLQLQFHGRTEGRLQPHDVQMPGGILHGLFRPMEDMRLSMVQLQQPTWSGRANRHESTGADPSHLPSCV